MGVPGLWDLLRPAAARTSLSKLSRDAFLSNRGGHRALKLGIDASIWIFHAQQTYVGENPFLRTIFFKITALMQHPVLPVFVFDGPNKPGQKRNQNVAGQFGTGDHRSRQFKALLDVCGLEWWNAPGEAETELAVMNRQGKIDAVLSDDVDALLFGATCLLRNNSPTLSGAQASSTGRNNSARGDMRAYEMYESSAVRRIWTSREDTALKTEEDCRMAMVLIGLLGGGDYAPEGLPSIGPTISFGLAHAGLADFLKHYVTDRSTFDHGLPEIHQRITDELRTNASKQIGRKYPDRANKLGVIPPTTLFPEFTLEAYLNPAASPLHDSAQGWPGFGIGEKGYRRGMARNEGRGDMEGLAKACEQFFEWGTKDLVCKKFAGETVGIFGAELMDEARRIVRARESRERLSLPPTSNPNFGASQSAPGSRITSFFQQAMPSSSPLPIKSSQPVSLQPTGKIPLHVLKIHSTRPDPTYPDMTEYRISYRPDIYIQRCHDAMTGSRLDPGDLSDGTKDRLGLRGRAGSDEAIGAPGELPLKGKDEIRTWMPEYLVQEAWPDLVQRWEEEKRAKVTKSPRKLKKAPPKAGAKVGGGSKTIRERGMDSAGFAAFFGTTQQPRRGKTFTPSATDSDEEVEAVELPLRRPRSSTVDLSMSSPMRSVSPSSSRSDGAGKKTRARPRPSTSLSSLPESIPPTQNDLASRATPRTRPKSKTKRTASPKRVASDNGLDTPEASARRSTSPKPRAWPFSKRVFSKSKSSPSAFASPAVRMGSRGSLIPTPLGGVNEPIDLCSTDSESQTPVRVSTRARQSTPRQLGSSPILLDSDVDTPVVKPSRRRKSANRIHSPPTSSPVLRESDLNTPSSPLTSVASSDSSPKRRTRSNKTGPSSQQSILDFPATAKHSQTPAASKKSPSPRKPKSKKKNYVVVSETSDEEVIDCTRSG
ncbi:hypothetical protein IAU60_002050 [Kwoniella sp. DSM 27419]